MKILNTTTGKIETLNHPYYECDCVPDLVVSDDTITWGEDADENPIQQADQASIDWWRDYLGADAEFLSAKANLVATLNYKEISELEDELSDAMNCDMGDQPAAGMDVIERWLEANQSA